MPHHELIQKPNIPKKNRLTIHMLTVIGAINRGKKVLVKVARGAMGRKESRQKGQR